MSFLMCRDDLLCGERKRQIGGGGTRNFFDWRDRVEGKKKVRGRWGGGWRVYHG